MRSSSISVLWRQHKSDALQQLIELQQRYNLANTFTAELFTLAAPCVSFACFYSDLSLYFMVVYNSTKRKKKSHDGLFPVVTQFILISVWTK